MKIRPRLIQFCLLVAALLPPVALAQLTFTTNNGTITITGYAGTNSTVVIPGTTNGFPVTSIGNSAFLDCWSVTNVIIPTTVNNIAGQAFTASGLTSMVIPDSVTNIGPSVFLNCYRLASVNIGNGVISIGDDAFYDCPQLTNIFIPQSVTNIIGTAFNDCTNLTAIKADAENPAFSSLGGVLFDKNQTTLIDFPGGLAGSYTIPASVSCIGEFAFTFCNLPINIPDSVTNIGQYAFYGCGNFTNLTLPNNVMTVGQYAFSACAGLTNIVIPPSVITIGIAAFGSAGLMAITVASNNPAFSSVAGVLFDSSQTTLVEFPAGKAGNVFKPGNYTVPSGVTSIGDDAFAGCPLGNITLPASLTSIGAGAFGDCTRLTDLTIPNSVTNIGDGAFAASGLTSLTIPASVTTLGWFGWYPNLRAVYFQGNAPGQEHGIPLISFVENATAYYLPGTKGWAGCFQLPSLPTALWLPQMQTGDGGFGVQTNQFGFNLNWASGQTVIVEASTNLGTGPWIPLQSVSLTNGSFYFSDPQWTIFPSRFYRLRSP